MVIGLLLGKYGVMCCVCFVLLEDGVGFLSCLKCISISVIAKGVE